MAHHLDRWLQIAVSPGIKELTVRPSSRRKDYNFPWSLLADGSGHSIRYLNLFCCAFCPTVGLGLRSMTRLDLLDVRITEDGLGCLVHNSFALQFMQLSRCHGMTRLKILRLLQRLSYLEVFGCHSLQVIESEAPNLSEFKFIGHHPIQLSLGVALQLKNLSMYCSGSIHYARAELPSSLPNVEALTLGSRSEMVTTPMLPSKFLHLKHLTFDLSGVTFSSAYDYCSLISFFNASLSLGTFFLNVAQLSMEHESVLGDSSHLRQMPGHRHDNLESVKIIGFSSVKNFVELTCHIIENITSLEYLTLDTTRGYFGRCSSNKLGACFPMLRGFIVS